jgi:AcrR family transcriptional regulator
MVNPEAHPVKRRRYNAPVRQEAALRTRGQILDAAAGRFAADGYARATVASIAAEAGVSVETVYKAFGGKPGLVRGLWERALAGEGPVPAEVRSDAVSGRSDDPRAIVTAWSRFMVEVAPRASPVMLLLAQAAVGDPSLAALVRELDARRRERMAHNANAIRRHLRPGLTVDAAADVMFVMTAPELYDLLVLRRGWSVEAYADFARRALIAELLED